MRFINYSDRPLIEVPSFCQDGSDHRGSKPNGIWLSVIGEDGSDSWKVYCDAKGIALKKHRTEIVIKENARILHLQNAAEVDSLTSTHGYFPECPAEFLKSDPNYFRSAICWRRVAEETRTTRSRKQGETWNRLAQRWTECAERFQHERDAVHRPPLRYRKPARGWAAEHCWAAEH